jgi:hypothetical protein
MTARLVAAFESACARERQGEHAKRVSAGLTNE